MTSDDDDYTRDQNSSEQPAQIRLLQMGNRAFLNCATKLDAHTLEMVGDGFTIFNVVKKVELTVISSVSDDCHIIINPKGILVLKGKEANFLGHKVDEQIIENSSSAQMELVYVNDHLELQPLGDNLQGYDIFPEHLEFAK
jgi:hypothetical protein